MAHDVVPRETVAKLCKQFGPVLKLQDTQGDDSKPLDGAQLLWALAGNESSFGANCGPRLEPAYWTGRYSKDEIQKEMNFAFGEDAASSLGQFQLMAVNAYRLGFKPAELRSDPEKATLATVSFLNQVVIGRQRARTLDDIGMCYNAGHIFKRDEKGEYIGLPEVTTAYLKRLRHNYYQEVIG